MRTQKDLQANRTTGGHWVWRDQDAHTQIRFVGRGPETQLKSVLSLLAGSPDRVARLRQVHSSTAVQASEGLCGEADALFTDQTDLAMGVATADCLPVILSGRRQSAAVHAGWRGLEGGILRHTLRRMTDSPETMAAWIGPGIGVCCYEVGQDVAARSSRRELDRSRGPSPLRSPSSGSAAGRQVPADSRRHSRGYEPAAVYLLRGRAAVELSA